MDPTSSQLAARTNPQAVSFAVPTSDGLFRTAGNTQSIYYRKGDQIYSLDAKLAQGVDVNAIPEYSGDWEQAGIAQKAGINRDIYNLGPLTGTLADVQSLINTKPTSGTITVNAGGPIALDTAKAAAEQAKVAATTKALTPEQTAALVAASGGTAAQPGAQNVTTGQIGANTGQNQWWGAAPAGTGQPSVAPSPTGTPTTAPTPAPLDLRAQAIANLRSMGYGTPDEGEIQGAMEEIRLKTGTVPGTAAVNRSTADVLAQANKEVERAKAMLAQENTPGQAGKPFAGSAWDTPEHNAVGNALSDKGVTVDPGAADDLAKANPLQFVDQLFTKLYGSMGLGDIKSQFTAYTQKLTDLKNERDDKIRDLTNNPWLSESMRAKQAQALTDKYENRISTLTDQANLMQTMYKDGMTQAQFLTGQAVSVFNNQFDAASQIALKQMDIAATKAENEAKMNIETFTDSFGTVTAIDKDTGKVIWQKNIGKGDSTAPTGTNLEVGPDGKPLTPQASKAVKLYNAITELTSNESGMHGAVGPISSKLPTFTTDTANFETYFKNLQSLMTIENLSLMKGVLSDSDIKILQQAASPLSLSMGEAKFKEELGKMQKVVQDALKRNGIDPATISNESAIDSVISDVLGTGTTNTSTTTPKFDSLFGL